MLNRSHPLPLANVGSFVTLGVLAAMPLVGCRSSSGEPSRPTVAGPERIQDYEASRFSFQTVLLKAGPSPQGYEDEPLPPGVKEVVYPSGSFGLRGWVQFPDPMTDRVPVLVYIHGGFAFGLQDLRDVAPFVREGYAVFAPTFRGENGNPGNFEFCFGEVDDALAAIRWIVEQPFADPARVFLFGHSTGAAIAELTTLFANVPVRLSGSVGGVYPRGFFEAPWAPFDPQRDGEVAFRMLLGNLRSMKRDHVAYVGTEDGAALKKSMVQSELSGAGPAPVGKLRLVIVPGDHVVTLPLAVEEFSSLTRSL
jgi:acetyl esterase/lipase